MAESPMAKRIPPKKLQPSNFEPLFPDGSTGVVDTAGAAVDVTGGEVFSVVVEVLVAEVVGFSVEVVEGVVLSVVVEVDVEIVVVLVEVAGVVGVSVVVVVVSFSGVKLVLNFGGIGVAGLSSPFPDWGHLSSARTRSSRVEFGFNCPISASVRLLSTHFVSVLLNKANLQFPTAKHPTQISSNLSQVCIS